MLIDRSHLSWALFSGISLVAGAVSYVTYVLNSPKEPSGGSAMGLFYGVVGTAMMLFAGLLAARKPLRIRRIGSAQFWLKGHLWLGTLCIPFILFHSGFGWGGPLEQLMWWALIIVAVSGFFGVAIQQFLPRLLWNRTPLETFEAQTPYQCDRLTLIADIRIAKLCKSSLDVPRSHLTEHFTRLVAAFFDIANRSGEMREKNAQKRLLLQNVSPPAVRDFFWAMARYAKNDAKEIRMESDFPELLATTYSGLRVVSEVSSPPAHTPLPTSSSSPAAPVNRLPSQPSSSSSSEKQQTPKLDSPSPEASRAEPEGKIAPGNVAKPQKVSPLELMKQKAAEKAKAQAEVTPAQSPLAAEKPEASNSVMAGGDKTGTPAAPNASGLTPLELMKQKAAEKAKAQAEGSATQPPVTEQHAGPLPGETVMDGKSTLAPAPPASNPSGLTPLEQMKRKAAEKAKAQAEGSATQPPVTEEQTGPPPGETVIDGKSTLAPAPPASNPSGLTPLEQMKQKAAEKAKAQAEESATQPPVTEEHSGSLPGETVMQGKSTLAPAPAASNPSGLTPLEQMRQKAAEKAKALAEVPPAKPPVTEANAEPTTPETAGEQKPVTPVAPNPSGLTPLEMMRQKAAEKAKAQSDPPPAQPPVAEKNAGPITPETAGEQKPATPATPNPSGLTPLEQMRQKAAEKAKAQSDPPPAQPPVAEKNAGPMALDTAGEQKPATPVAPNPSGLTPLEMMKRKAAEKVKPQAEVAATPPAVPSNKPAAQTPAGNPSGIKPAVAMTSSQGQAAGAAVVRPVPAAVPAAASPNAVVPPTASEVALLREFYLSRVRPFLAENHSGRNVRGSALVSEIEARRLFQQQKSELPEVLHADLDTLQEFCEIRRQVEIQRNILRWMHWWLIIHVPAAVVLLIFLVAHVVMALRVVPFGI